MPASIPDVSSPAQIQNIRSVMDGTAARVTTRDMIFDVADDGTVIGVSGPSPELLPKTTMDYYLSAVAKFRAALPPKPESLRWRADGEPSSYAVIRGDRWIMHCLLNGEMHLSAQEALMDKIVAAFEAP